MRASSRAWAITLFVVRKYVSTNAAVDMVSQRMPPNQYLQIAAKQREHYYTVLVDTLIAVGKRRGRRQRCWLFCASGVSHLAQDAFAILHHRSGCYLYVVLDKRVS